MFFILCFHWFHFICWQGIWLSILIVWNQWMNGRGEKSWSSSNNNNSSCSKQWTNISTNDSINNQNLQYKTISNPPNWRWVTTSNLSMQCRQTKNALHFLFYVILNRFTHRFTYLDCLILTCILITWLFTHIELFFYSINPNSNPVDNVSRIDR